MPDGSEICLPQPFECSPSRFWRVSTGLLTFFTGLLLLPATGLVVLKLTIAVGDLPSTPTAWLFGLEPLAVWLVGFWLFLGYIRIRSHRASTSRAQLVWLVSFALNAFLAMRHAQGWITSHSETLQSSWLVLYCAIVSITSFLLYLETGPSPKPSKD